MAQNTSVETIVLSFELPDGKTLTQEAPTDIYLWDILTSYQKKFRINLLNKLNNEQWLIPSGTCGNIKLSTVGEWHQTMKQLGINSVNGSITFKLEFVNSGFQTFEIQSQISNTKTKLPRQRSVGENDIHDVLMKEQKENDKSSNEKVIESKSNDNDNNDNDGSKTDIDMFDNASRRPVIHSNDPIGQGGVRSYTETEHKLGAIGRQLYHLSKDIDAGTKFDTAKKTLRAIVNNLLKGNEKHRKMRVTNEKLIKNLLQYDGSLQFLNLLGFVKDSTNEEFLIFKGSNDKVFFNNVLSQISTMRPVYKEPPIPKVERDLKVYRSDELHKYRIEHSGLDTVDRTNDNNNEKKNDKDSEMKNDSNGSSISGVISKQSKYGKKNNNPLTQYMQSRGVSNSKKNAKQREEKRAEAVALRMAIADSKRQNRLKNPEKLMSTEKRKELLGIKDKEYNLTLIQVEFPSKLVLEGKFHPREPISNLAKYVQDALDPNFVAVCPEYKLVLPPREVLKDFTKTFRQMSMIPACTVRFTAEIGAGYKGRFLKNELCSHISHEYTAIPSETKEDDGKENDSKMNVRGKGNNNSRRGNSRKPDPKRDAALKRLLRFKK